MTIRRITISVPEETAKKIKTAAGKTPVSAWITELVEERLSDAEVDRLFAEVYREAAPTPADKRRAAEIFERITKPRRKRVA